MDSVKDSLIGRINSIKMMVLPKILYLFQCLTLFIPLSFFKSFDSVISSIIWNGKHSRLRKMYLFIGLDEMVVCPCLI